MIKKFLSKQLNINMLSGVVTTSINTLLLVVAYPVYLNFLNYELYGVWIVLATILNLAQLGNLGISPAITKLISEEYSNKNIKIIESYIVSSLSILALTGGCVLLFLVYFSGIIINLFNLGTINEIIFLQLLPYIGVLSVYVIIVQTLNAILAGLGRMDIANYCMTSGRVVAVSLSVTLLLAGYGIESLLIGESLAYVFVHIVSIHFIGRIVKIRMLNLYAWDLNRVKALFRYGGTLFGSSLIAILFDPFNKMILSRYVGVAVIPVYELSYRGAVQFRNLFEATLRPILPEISHIAGRSLHVAVEEIRAINKQGMKIILLFGVPLYTALYLEAPWFLELWLGVKYQESIPSVFRLVLVGTFITLIAVPSYYTLLGLGKVHYTIVSAIIISGGNFLLISIIILLTQHISVQSVFINLIFSCFLSSIYLIRQAKKETNQLGEKRVQKAGDYK